MLPSHLSRQFGHKLEFDRLNGQKEVNDKVKSSSGRIAMTEANSKVERITFTGHENPGRKIARSSEAWIRRRDEA